MRSLPFFQSECIPRSMAVKNAIKNLPHHYRLIFNLYAVDNIPQEEIGNMLGMTHNNVRTQYHRAKKKILELLKTELEYENR